MRKLPILLSMIVSLGVPLELITGGRLRTEPKPREGYCDHCRKWQAAAPFTPCPMCGRPLRILNSEQRATSICEGCNESVDAEPFTTCPKCGRVLMPLEWD